MEKYTLAKLTDPEHEIWLLLDSPAGRFWTDEPEEAFMYDTIDQLPETCVGEYPVKLIFDEQGEWVQRIDRNGQG